MPPARTSMRRVLAVSLVLLLGITLAGAFSKQPARAQSDDTPTPSEAPTTTPGVTPTPSDTLTATDTQTETPTPIATPTAATPETAAPGATESATQMPSPTLTLTPGTTSTVTLTPTATPTSQLVAVQGVARYQNHKPDNAGISVSVLSDDRQLLDKTITNGMGAYTVHVPRSAPFSVVAEAPLYLPFEVSLLPGDLLPPIALKGGDLNADQCVTSDDLALLTANYGKRNTPESDVNNDGVTDVVDLALLSGNFDSTCTPLGATPTPTPGSSPSPQMSETPTPDQVTSTEPADTASATPAKDTDTPTPFEAVTPTTSPTPSPDDQTITPEISATPSMPIPAQTATPGG